MDVKTIERVFGVARSLDHGLGIVETGFVAGRLSALFAIGFEVLGVASQSLDSDACAIAAATSSRRFGETAINLQEYVPSIPAIDRYSCLAIALPEGASPREVVEEVGAVSAIGVALRLCRFLANSISYYLSRCSEVCDRPFSRGLREAAEVISEAFERLNLPGDSEGLIVCDQHNVTLALLALIEPNLIP